MRKLKAAISHGIQRTLNREATVRMTAVLNPSVAFNAEHRGAIMAHIAAEGMGILSTGEETIFIKVPAGMGTPGSENFHLCAVKIIGGAAFEPVAPQLPDSYSSDDEGNNYPQSQYQTVDNALSLECDLSF